MFCEVIVFIHCIACEQALFWVSEASRARTRGRTANMREDEEILSLPQPLLSRLLSRVYFSRYPPNGELARRLYIAWSQYVESKTMICSFPLRLTHNLLSYPFLSFSLRKHPFLLALRRRGRFARRNVCDSAAEISY